MIATAAKTTIVEVEEIVQTGELDPDSVHLPGIYVDRIVLSEELSKPIEVITYSNADGSVDIPWVGKAAQQ